MSQSHNQPPARPASNPSTPASPASSPSSAASPQTDLHHLEAQRRENRKVAAELGFAPYGLRTDDLQPLAHAKGLYSDLANSQYNEQTAKAKLDPSATITDARPVVKVAGRVMLLRDNGKLIWMTLRDNSGDLQIAVSQKDVPEKDFRLAKVTDLSDIMIATGKLMKTKTGELTVWATSLTLGTKSLAQPPEKHAGLADVELRYRQRYVDMWSNPQTTKTFELRSRIVARIRRFLDAHQYLEVETPMLQLLAGGAAARPFKTHMNALGVDLFMRIAPELYLKRLLVGGMPRVYEINRNFRNEGLDKQHNPEFTMLEAYHAFGDVETVMNLTEQLIRDAATMIASELDSQDATSQSTNPRPSTDPSNLFLPFGDLNIDYGSPFLRAPYPELFERKLGCQITNTDQVLKIAAERNIKTAGVDPILVVNELFEEFAEKSIDPARPTFITDYPAAISPLTRPKSANPLLADRADLFIGGMEIAPHYTELNDPDIQAAKFKEQLATADTEKAKEEATFRTFDQDFINALKVGMPPAGGMGLGIDRLVMLLTNQRTIRDVVLFPLMK